ncbi:hypothetical protein HX017_16205 [Myroides marinus]|jgi:hypothetical protein|uniref:Lipoprotein n=1 Tax=Myroides marinus TaxID=703342 RepID=A0A161UWD0_9FLAO|nr:hypothetical protein [Myroides marinus]MDR0228292.1 hypothetical protein [Flavobacteriaceae bacterium]KZE82271.1 hypothetical protein AV926_07180 [Myroides marinus]MDM1352012.1 hypothetical protein [Myroides marinus]MDM1359221.1 hypothetical protein [Myroides marinus]MDM1366480.1 hypothetical protein [Myroides marinus]
MKKTAIYSFYVLLLISCVNNNEIERILLDKNEEKTIFWDYYASEDNINYQFLGYKMSFVSKNNYRLFYSKRKDKIYQNHHVREDLIESISEREWHVDPKNMKMSLDIDLFIIEKYNKDTIFMKGDGYNGRYMLIKNIK